MPTTNDQQSRIMGDVGAHYHSRRPFITSNYRHPVDEGQIMQRGHDHIQYNLPSSDVRIKSEVGL
eukprot:scaffold13898_cov30-Tisochrysis_lutea.AAC.9